MNDDKSTEQNEIKLEPAKVTAIELLFSALQRCKKEGIPICLSQSDSSIANEIDLKELFIEKGLYQTINNDGLEIKKDSVFINLKTLSSPESTDKANNLFYLSMTKKLTILDIDVFIDIYKNITKNEINHNKALVKIHTLPEHIKMEIIQWGINYPDVKGLIRKHLERTK
jgi:hypothetical protein